MKRLFLVLLVLTACRTQDATTTPDVAPTNTATPQKALGGPGAICRCGENNVPGGQCVAVNCQSGLVCGYGCGIPGCDSTCMTPEEEQGMRNVP